MVTEVFKPKRKKINNKENKKKINKTKSKRRENDGLLVKNKKEKK